MMAKPRISEFSIEVPAKWVLSGEHSVMRGKHAIAFPYADFTLSVAYRPAVNASDELTITANPFQSQIKALLGRACEWLKADPKLLNGGELEIQSRIPIGAGLGSSAALCVAIARFVLWKTHSEVDEHWIPLATHLEDVFHGKSSGMDISVIAHSQPILYSMTERAKPIADVKKTPRFELFDSGKRGHTRDCVKQVATQPAMTQSVLDDKMEEATQLSLQALHEFTTAPAAAEEKLARAINQAQACFEAWGLVPEELVDQRNELLKQGALAVKLTGAGLGGFWVALWPST